VKLATDARTHKQHTKLRSQNLGQNCGCVCAVSVCSFEWEFCVRLCVCVCVCVLVRNASRVVSGELLVFVKLVSA
jgi:hypothetical protein